MTRPKFTTLGWLGVAALASITAVQGTGVESIAPQEKLAAAPRSEALENWRVARLTRVHFGSREAELGSAEEDALLHFVKRYWRANESVIELRGYTDGAESTAGARALSTSRAVAIAKFLVANGVPQQRVVVIGLGEIDGTNNPEHRRVDVRIFTPPAEDLVSRDARVSEAEPGAAESALRELFGAR